MNNYEIKRLTSIKELVRVMEFLKHGFSESESFSYKMLKYLINVNSNKEFFGFYLLDSKIIYGAILTPFQGYYLDSYSTRNEIYSICSWYVHPKFRGIPSLKLQSRAISALKDSIITDYTPGINATKIHKAFGFDSMNSFVYRNYIGFKTLLNRSSKFILKEIPLKNFKFGKITLLNEDFIYIKNFCLKIDNSDELYFCGSLRKKKIACFKINYFMVLWTSDDYAFIRHISSIQKHLLKLYKCFGILFYSDKLIKIKGSNLKVDNVSFLIKNGNGISYIPPIGSELSIGQY